MTPRTLFTWLARAEVVTWTLLLLGMALKYVTRTTELGVSVFGLVHGVMFLAYVLVTLVLWVDQRWRLREVALVLACGVPPFATLYAERRVERLELAPDRWRLRAGGDEAASVPERAVAAALARPVAAALVGALAVGTATLVLLLIGPPPVPGKTSGSVCASWSAIVPMRIPPRIESPSPAQPLYLRGETGCADAGSSSDAVGSPSSLSAPLPADSGTSTSRGGLRTSNTAKASRPRPNGSQMSQNQNHRVPRPGLGPMTTTSRATRLMATSALLTPSENVE